ncbi:MAG: hypothetical protein ACKOWD_02755 [Rhodoferax sp.]
MKSTSVGVVFEKIVTGLLHSGLVDNITEYTCNLSELASVNAMTFEHRQRALRPRIFRNRIAFSLEREFKDFMNRNLQPSICSVPDHFRRHRRQTMPLQSR